jgi:hypothetical protein
VRRLAWSLGLVCLGFAAVPVDAATDKIVVDEFLLRCADGRADGAFVELVATGPGQTFDAALGIRLTSPSCSTVADLPGVFARRAGQPWPEGQHFLIATAAFQPLTGVAPDTVFTAAPTSNGGSIILYRRSGTTLTVLGRVDYSSASGLAPTPPPGRSAFSALPGLFHWSPDPSPTRSDGVMARASGCFADPRRPIRITELATRCGSGDRSGGFVEIAPTADDQVLDSDLSLRALDRSGAQLFDVPLGFGTMTGTPWLTNHPWLVGGNQLQSTQGDLPDLVWPAPLDTTAGRLVLHGSDATGAEVVLSEVAYGTHELPAPPAGASLAWDMFTGRYVLRSPASPTDFAVRPHQSVVCAAPSSVRIQEILTSCSASGAHDSYVQLLATAAGETRDRTLVLEIRDAAGTFTARVAAGFGSLAGTPWPSGTSWLLATTGITNDALARADTVLPVPLDPVAGRIDMMRSIAGRTELIQSLSWGGTQATPPPGQALRRFSDTDYRLVTSPVPLTSSGQSLRCPKTPPSPPPPPPPPPPAPGDPNAVRLSGMMLSCVDGSTGAQFVQIDRTGITATVAADLQLSILDRDGRTIGTRTNLFPYGVASWGGRNSLVIGGSGFRSAFGFDPDETLPAAMDTVGGAIQLFRGHVLSELHYGEGGVAAPTPATALVLDSDTWRADSLPHPSGFGGDGLMSPFCGGYCALQRVHLGLDAPRSMVPAAGSRSDLYNVVSYDLPRAEFDVSSRNWSAELLLSDEYAIPGLASPETLETFVDVLEAHRDTCIRNICYRSTRRLHVLVNGELADSLPADARARGRLHARVPFAPGQSTVIQVFAAASGVLLANLQGRVVGRLGFARPQGGARVVSCAGYDFERALVVHAPEWSVSPHTIAIDWPVSADSGFTANVERLDESDPTPTWRLRASLPVAPSGVIRFVDNKVGAENTYRYRLTWSDAFGGYTSDEVRIHAPRLPSFALLGALPNPSHGALRLAFELPDPAGVHVELFDLLGRRVREVRTSLGSGPQTVALDQGRRLAPGLYQVRLEAGERHARTTVVVLP